MPPTPTSAYFEDKDISASDLYNWPLFVELWKEALHKKNANRGRLSGKFIMGREELKGGLSKNQNVQFGPDPSVHTCSRSHWEQLQTCPRGKHKGTSQSLRAAWSEDEHTVRAHSRDRYIVA